MHFYTIRWQAPLSRESPWRSSHKGLAGAIMPSALYILKRHTSDMIFWPQTTMQNCNSTHWQKLWGWYVPRCDSQSRWISQTLGRHEACSIGMLQGSQLHCIGFPAHWTAFLWLNVEPGVDQQCETKQQKCQNDIFPCLRQVACHQLHLQILQPGVQTHGLRFQSPPCQTARLLGGMISKSSHKSQIHPLPGNSIWLNQTQNQMVTESVPLSESARQMIMKNKWFQRQLDVSHNQFVSEWSASNSQMRQDKITQSKDMFMFQNQFHNYQDVSTWISLPKAKGNTGFRINDEITISKILVAESMSWSQSNRHNPRTKDVWESAHIKDRFVSETIQDHSQRTHCLWIRSVQNHNQNKSVQNHSLH